MKTAIIIVALCACVASAQQYRLVLDEKMSIVTTVDGGTAYGWQEYYDPELMHLWSRKHGDLYLPTNLPAVVYDSDRGTSVGRIINLDRRTSQGWVRFSDGSLVLVFQGVWNHCAILGTGRGKHVGFLTGYDSALWAYRWDDAGNRYVIHPTNQPGWQWSIAEDANVNGTICGWADNVPGIWVGERMFMPLEVPFWATIQGCARCINVHGDVGGDVSSPAKTRPGVWIGGQWVQLADTLGFVWGVNDRREAVGWVSDGTSPDDVHLSVPGEDDRFEPRAFGTFGAMWRLPDMRLIDLNTLAPDGDGWVVGHEPVTITAAYEISPESHIAVEVLMPDGTSRGGTLVNHGGGAGLGGAR